MSLCRIIPVIILAAVFPCKITATNQQNQGLNTTESPAHTPNTTKGKSYAHSNQVSEEMEKDLCKCFKDILNPENNGDKYCRNVADFKEKAHTYIVRIEKYDHTSNLMELKIGLKVMDKLILILTDPKLNLDPSSCLKKIIQIVKHASAHSTSNETSTRTKSCRDTFRMDYTQVKCESLQLSTQTELETAELCPNTVKAVTELYNIILEPCNITEVQDVPDTKSSSTLTCNCKTMTAMMFFIYCLIRSLNV